MKPSQRLKQLNIKGTRLCFLFVITFALGLLTIMPQTLLAKDPINQFSLHPLANYLGDAVVNISTAKKRKSFVQLNPKLRKKFKNSRPSKKTKPVAVGSGFVIDPSGLVITNNHVIKNADEITVNFKDGSKLVVEKIVGKDAKTDLALLKVRPEKPLKSVRFGSAEKARVGDWVMAIGNPFGLGGSVTLGIISAKSRRISNGPYDNFIQTDAAINKGNSGGPLFNMKGEVIGVNTAIISPSGGSVGIGFSVPSETVISIIDQFKRYGETRRGWLGVRIQTVSKDIAPHLGLTKAHGALIASVTPGSPAEKAGIKAGDVITRYGGKEVTSMKKLPFLVALTPVEKPVEIEIMRLGQVQKVNVKVDRVIESKNKHTGEKSGQRGPESQVHSNALLGMILEPLTPSLRKSHKLDETINGLLVKKIVKGSIAAQKEIVKGDVISEMNNIEITSHAKAKDLIEKIKKDGRGSVLILVRKAVPGAGRKVIWETRFLALPFRQAKKK